MSIIKERYASAVNSSNLSVKTETTYSDTDLLTAMGLASRYFPLGAALQRLFVDGKATECVQIMAEMARKHAFRVNVRLTTVEAQVMAQKVLAWYRHGVCTACGGVGKGIIIEPKPHLSEDDCRSCRGTGKRPFEPNFSVDVLDVAIWLRDQVAKHQAQAGREAMQMIAPTLDL